MTSTTNGGNTPNIDLDALVGSLSAALSPQISKMIEAEFVKRGGAMESPSFLATGQSTVNIERGGEASRNKSSGAGLADNDGEEDTPHEPVDRVGQKRKSRSELEFGELSDTNDDDDDEKALDPIEMYLESKGTWKVPKETSRYLDAYAKRSLNRDERRSMLETFPIPDVTSVAMPRVDEPFLNLLKQQGVSLK